MRRNGEDDTDEGEEWSNVQGVSAIDVFKYEATYEQKVDIPKRENSPPESITNLTYSPPVLRLIKLCKPRKRVSS